MHHLNDQVLEVPKGYIVSPPTTIFMFLLTVIFTAGLLQSKTGSLQLVEGGSGYGAPVGSSLFSGSRP